MGKKKPTARGDDENPPQGGLGKSKKKAVVIDDDEYSVSTELSEEPPVQDAIVGKKKGKKKGSQQQAKEEEEDGDEKVPVVAFSGKKAAKGKKGGDGVFASSNFGLLGDGDDDDDDDDDEDESEDEVAPKTAGKSGGVSLFKSSVFAAFDDESDEEAVQNSEDVPVIEFTGKKSSKGGKVFSAASFDVLDDQEDDKEAEDGEEPLISFSGKKKKSSKSSKKSSNKFVVALPDEENDDDTSVTGSVKIPDESVEVDDDDGAVVAFSGKKKSSKKKGTPGPVVAIASEDGDVVKPEQTSTTAYGGDGKASKTEEMAETSKNKKKKKKSGRTAQEEDDLDKILAELGEAPPIAKTTMVPPQEEKVNLQPEPIVPAEAEVENGGIDGEEEKEESSAAKKKKKKKEKEKEKKAAAAAAAEKVEDTKVESEPKKSDAKGKAADKKVPKHVREMQELMARRKEMEEKKAKEEEEKRRKEEEERLKQEELERQAEEARRRKKEREKEKLLKKKQEGKLLTGKQKEEQKRLEAMRNQFLANAGVNVPTADKDGAQSKRPKYQTKKSKPHQQRTDVVKAEENVEAKDKEPEQQGIVAEVESVEADQVEDLESVTVGEKSEAANGVGNNGMDDDDDDWDAKSWDDVNIQVKGAFDDEEVDSEPEPEPVVKKEVKPPPVSKEPAKPTVAARKPVKGKQVASEEPKQSEDLRSPICCIMGHVDTGKTKLLDCIRGTNVQEGEAGGITQQIGATYFPAENIRERTKELKADATLKVPGLLVIDTPGHESFTNLRSRGSGLCDIAILVVDIMHGLEPQTIESLNLLKMRNTEFIVALNKVDRLYGWKTCRNAPIQKALKQQNKDVLNEFNRRLIEIITQFKEQGLNTELYYKNKEMGETFSIVPTSAISGEGIPDLLLLLVHWTQKTMAEKLTFSNEVQCTVLEVKVIEGHGTTIDVVLVNGVLHEGDQIVVCGMQGPIATTIRALLTPHPMKELRVKGTYLHHKEIKAAQGIKITAQGLEHAIAGTSLYVVGLDDDMEDVKEVAMEDMKSVMSRIDKSGEGVYVQASTLGSLEALLEFLKTPAVNIPVSGIGIGPVHKKDVMKASVMLEKKKEYATILAFDVKVTPEARELASDLGVTIFIADIIYHLFDQFKAYIDNLKEERKKGAENDAVFPCILKILPNCVFMNKDPIVLGVDVLEGIVKIGTPICIPQRDFIDIGRIASIENNHKPVDYAKKGQKVAIKIVGTNPEEQQKMFGRHFDMEDELVSHISRTSIDVLKENYRDDLSLDDWRLVVKLKTLFKIQ